MISVIIPIYNEERVLLENSAYFKNLARQTELIFVDGESVDRSMEIAAGYGKVLSSGKGRAIQMNCGAQVARSDILLFLHVDTIVSPDAILSIVRKIKNEGYCGGCLTQRIAKDGIIYRFIENFCNIRVRINKAFYGDQGIFVRKDIFLKMNGFRDVPIMEDILFTRNLRKLGKIAVLSDKILVSPRRWEKRGIIRTVFLYSFLDILFCLKVPLGRIKLFYDDLR